MAISAVCKPAKLLAADVDRCITRTCGHILPQKLLCTVCRDTLQQELGLLSVAQLLSTNTHVLGGSVSMLTTEVMRCYHIDIYSNKAITGIVTGTRGSDF